MVMAVEGQARAARQIIDTARHTAALYLMQFQHITE
jgi:3-oxoacyl-[acyl-carrier-protein] synthase-3